MKEKGQGKGRQDTSRVGEGGREEESQRGGIHEKCRRNDGQPAKQRGGLEQVRPGSSNEAE